MLARGREVVDIRFSAHAGFHAITLRDMLADDARRLPAGATGRRACGHTEARRAPGGLPFFYIEHISSLEEILLNACSSHSFATIIAVQMQRQFHLICTTPKDARATGLRSHCRACRAYDGSGLLRLFTRWLPREARQLTLSAATGYFGGLDQPDFVPGFAFHRAGSQNYTRRRRYGEVLAAGTKELLRRLSYYFVAGRHMFWAIAAPCRRGRCFRFSMRAIVPHCYGADVLASALPLTMGAPAIITATGRNAARADAGSRRRRRQRFHHRRADSSDYAASSRA